jgi:hypothetical protein
MRLIYSSIKLLILSFSGSLGIAIKPKAAVKKLSHDRHIILHSPEEKMHILRRSVIGNNLFRTLICYLCRFRLISSPVRHVAIMGFVKPEVWQWDGRQCHYVHASFVKTGQLDQKLKRGTHEQKHAQRDNLIKYIFFLKVGKYAKNGSGC